MSSVQPNPSVARVLSADVVPKSILKEFRQYEHTTRHSNQLYDNTQLHRPRAVPHVPEVERPHEPRQAAARRPRDARRRREGQPRDAPRRRRGRLPVGLKAAADHGRVPADLHRRRRPGAARRRRWCCRRHSLRGRVQATDEGSNLKTGKKNLFCEDASSSGSPTRSTRQGHPRAGGSSPSASRRCATGTFSGSGTSGAAWPRPSKSGSWRRGRRATSSRCSTCSGWRRKRGGVEGGGIEGGRGRRGRRGRRGLRRLHGPLRRLLVLCTLYFCCCTHTHSPSTFHQQNAHVSRGAAPSAPPPTTDAAGRG